MEDERAKTGITGLDEILRGGLPRNRIHLVQGQPGSGKTTLALQFLIQGASEGERGFYITLTESMAEIRQAAASHGWDLATIEIIELSAAQQLISRESQNTVFRTSAVELNETAEFLAKRIEASKPDRLVIDSMAEVHQLAGEPWAYRLQVLRLKQLLSTMNTTTLLVDDSSSDQQVSQVRSIAHGVIFLEFFAPEYGRYRRRLRIQKMRGTDFSEGSHDLMIRKGGMEVYPRLVAAELGAPLHGGTVVGSGIPELDGILGGGLDRGTTNLLVGPAGVGKSTMAAQFAIRAAERGERAMIYLFEERVETVIQRWQGLGRDIRPFLRKGLIRMRQIDPAELSPGEFSYRVRQSVEEGGVSVLVIDSLAGYRNAMAGENTLLLQLHELQSYLGNHGVTSILVNAQHGLALTLAISTSYADVSYLADTIVMLRFYEFSGTIRKALSVAKRRTGVHETTIRDFALGPGGIIIGRPLTEFQGILTGNPSYISQAQPFGAEA